MSFKQTLPDPNGKNQYLGDATLRSIIQYYFFEKCPPNNGSSQPNNECMNEIHDQLIQFGSTVVSKTMLDNRFAAENVNNHPRLRTFDAWQNRIDQLEIHESWRYFQSIAAKDGLVATGYGPFREKYGPMARVLQFAKLYLFDASSAVYTCPLAMTDGAARLLELQLSSLSKAPRSPQSNHAQISDHKRQLYSEVFNHLTTTDTNQFWTSGQWMTEKTGGSDVRGTQTIATPVRGTELKHTIGCYYHLNGFKWFTSATDSQITLALAKIEGSDDLSLFLVRIRDEKTGKLNGIKIHKLKDKLGTKALPTAELALKNTEALLVSEPGKGVQTISCMLNITRLYNSICACSAMRRMIVIIQDYSNKRKTFGKLLKDHELYTHWLAKMVAEQIGCLHLVMNVVHMLGKTECGTASKSDEELLRLLTPVTKLYTGKRCVQLLSEGVEMMGGQGYIEDTGIPALLRNGQVLPIWEGTTIVLSLDVLRVLVRNRGAIAVWEQRILHTLDAACQKESQLGAICEKIREAVAQVIHYLKSSSKSELRLQLYARELSFSIAQTYIASLLVQHANHNVVEQFILDHEPLAPVRDVPNEDQDKSIVNREQFVSKL